MSIDAQPAHGEKVHRTLMSIDSGLTVGRGPVPRQRRSYRKHRDAGGLSYRQAPPLSVGRGPVLRHALIELAITSDFFLQCNPKICYTNTYANT